MNFYTQQHNQYCGIDLHTKAMYICILADVWILFVNRRVVTSLLTRERLGV